MICAQAQLLQRGEKIEREMLTLPIRLFIHAGLEIKTNTWTHPIANSVIRMSQIEVSAEFALEYLRI